MTLGAPKPAEPPSYGKQRAIEAITYAADHLAGAIRWAGVHDADLANSIELIRKTAVAKVLAACVVLALTLGVAYAHIAGHPEWNEWLMRQHNTFGTPCCDGKNDAYLLSGDDIRPFLGRQMPGEEAPDAEWHHWYDVRLHGQWFPVYYHMFRARLKGEAPNPTGSALIWYTWYESPLGYGSGGTAQIWCFVPPAGT